MNQAQIEQAMGDYVLTPSQSAPSLARAVGVLMNLLVSDRIQVWVCADSRYGSDIRGCELETDRCGWRSWDEAQVARIADISSVLISTINDLRVAAEGDEIDVNIRQNQ